MEAPSGHGLLRARLLAKSEGLERSEVLTRRVRTSVPARNKPRQDQQINLSEQNRQLQNLRFFFALLLSFFENLQGYFGWDLYVFIEFH